MIIIEFNNKRNRKLPNRDRYELEHLSEKFAKMKVSLFAFFYISFVFFVFFLSSKKSFGSLSLSLYLYIYIYIYIYICVCVCVCV